MNNIDEEILDKIIEILEKQPEIREAILFDASNIEDFYDNTDFLLILKGRTVRLNTALKIELEFDKLNCSYKLDIIPHRVISDERLKELIKCHGTILFTRK